MKVKVQTTVKEEKEMEIVFPFYGGYGDIFDSGGAYETAWLLHENGDYLELTRRWDRDTNTFEVEKDKVHPVSFEGLIEEDNIDKQSQFKKEFFELLGGLDEFMSTVLPVK